MKTPFEEAGYTGETRFKVLVNYISIKKNEIVRLHDDDRSSAPYFTTRDGRVEPMFLPGEGYYEELEVVKQGPLTIIDMAKTLEAGDLHEALSENFEELSIIDLRATVVGLSRILVEKERELAILREDINEIRGTL